MAEQKRFVQYMCRYCGAKETKSISFGRPMPGKCPRKKNGGPHLGSKQTILKEEDGKETQ